MPEFISVVHGPEFARIRAQLRKEEKTLDNRLFRVQHRVVNQLVNEAQARVRTVEVSGGPAQHTGLRNRIARSLRAMQQGGTSRVFTRMRDREEENLPYALDRIQGWRHPLFGDRSHWYQERPVQPGWFTDTFEDADERILRNMFEELEDSIDRIAEAD